MSFEPSTEVCGRLRRMLIAGLGLAAIGTYFTLRPLGLSLSSGFPWMSGAGLLALLFGAGLIFAAGVGFAVEGAWQFRLKTLFIAVTLVAVMLAAWPVWVGPTFFERVTVSTKDRAPVIKHRPPAEQSQNSFTITTFVETPIPLFQIGLWIPVFFPLMLLPFVLRPPQVKARPNGREG